VASLLEHVAAVTEGAGAEAVARFTCEPSLEAVPVLDRWDRPVGLHRRGEALAGDEPASEVLRVQAVESVAAVARRAMGRPRTSRFDPLLCCDGRGRYRGVVRIERLLEALAH
jgi:hypothetical protein